MSYCTIRGEDAGHLKGLVEAGLGVCLSVKLSEVPLSRRANDEAGTHHGVKDSLLGGRWKPCSALAMVRFLMDMRLANEENGPDLGEIYRLLFRRALTTWRRVRFRTQKPPGFGIFMEPDFEGPGNECDFFHGFLWSPHRNRAAVLDDSVTSIGCRGRLESKKRTRPTTHSCSPVCSVFGSRSLAGTLYTCKIC